MKKLMVAAFAVAVMAAAFTASTQPSQAQAGFIAGGPVGVIWHAQVKNRCHNKPLTQQEATRTFWFPTLSVIRAYRDCYNKKKK